MTKSGNRSNRADLRKQRKKYTVVAQVPAEERIRANQISATLPPVWLCALTHLISVKYVGENTKGTLSVVTDIIQALEQKLGICVKEETEYAKLLKLHHIFQT